MASGYKFSLTEFYRDDMNGSYLLTEVEHAGVAAAYGNATGDRQEHYSNSFKCIPASVPFRPQRTTQQPTINGPQPAVVVGPSGEEIYTDQYGRVKVQFFWDRLGKKNENSSCWIRVSQLFAGKGWGAMFLPRIGQEVLVDFLEGDPDQPVVTGRVYNADQTTPGTLPDHMNISGWRTHSTKGGSEHDANVLAFDDTKGSEVFYMRAEKDMAIRVQNNEDTHIMNNQTITVDNDRTEVVTTGNETVEIKKGDRSHKITMGNESLDVAQGNRSIAIDMGNDDLKISMGNQSTKLDLGAASTEAMQSITLTVGQSSIKIDQMGVTIKGMMITIEGQVQTQVKGLMTQVNGTAMLQCQGGITMIN
jgi:type VI secretion system secreted protein VgrG